MRLSTLAVVALAFIACTVAGSEKAATPQLVIVPNARGATDTTLAIFIQNAQMPCPSFFVDRIFLSGPVSNRPETVLALSVRDATGRPLPVGRSVTGTYMTAKPQDLVRIDCGMVLGQVVDLSSGMWFGPLPPGDYRVTATLSIGLGKYAAEKPEFVRSLAAVSGKGEADTRRAMRDMVLTSEEVLVRVGPGE